MLKTGKHYNDFLENVKKIKILYNETINMKGSKNRLEKLRILLKNDIQLLKWYENERLILENYFLFSLEKYKILIDIFDNDKLKIRNVFGMRSTKGYVLYLIKEFISIRGKLTLYTTQLDNLPIGVFAKSIYLGEYTKNKDYLAIEYLKKLGYNDEYFKEYSKEDIEKRKKEVEVYKKEKTKKIDENWMYNYDKLEGYLKKNYFYDTKEINPLFNNREWLNWQFQHCKKQEIGNEKVELFKNIGLDLSDKGRDRVIKTNINLINKFYQDFGKIPVTDKYKNFIKSLLSKSLSIKFIELLDTKVIELYIYEGVIDYNKIISQNLNIQISIVDIIEKFIIENGLLTKKTNKVLFEYLLKIKDGLVIINAEEKNKLKNLGINI